MSDVEIIEAIRLSHPILLDTPAGVLSIIAHYGRPNVYTFSGREKITITTYHYPAVKTIYTKRSLAWLTVIRDIVGSVGDTIYLRGYDDSNVVLFSFNMSTHTFTYLTRIGLCLSLCISPTRCVYVHRGYGLVSYPLDSIPPVGKEIPSTILTRTESESFFSRGSVYIIGGTDHNYQKVDDCTRYDTNENKWHPVASLPVPSRVLSMTEKDGSLVVITTTADVFIHNMDKNAWSKAEWDKDFMKLSSLLLRYSNGKFYAVSEANKRNPVNIVWESSSPEEPWEPILEIPQATSAVHIHLNTE